MTSAGQPIFSFDFNSPYAYLAAHRVDPLLGAAVRWQPIAFAFVIRALDRIPWSLPTRGPRG
jgi:2-hydroxychromene-2-carboxylate isomerase